MLPMVLRRGAKAVSHRQVSHCRVRVSQCLATAPAPPIMRLPTAAPLVTLISQVSQTSHESKAACWTSLWHLSWGVVSGVVAACAAVLTGAKLPVSATWCESDSSDHRFPSTLESSTAYVVSQEHLLRPTDYNPTPTMLPPPIAGLSSHHLRHRFVASIIGLPLRGKAYTARRLKQYLEFFHGAEVQLFNVNDYLGPSGDEQILQALKAFFEGANSDPNLERKHVSSGRFAILYPGDTYGALDSMWSGHSKSRRRSMSQVLEAEVQAHVMFLEIQVNDTTTHRQTYMDRIERARGLQPGDMAQHIGEYAQRFVTIQADGTEDDLTYMKLINYNCKVLTNNMMRSFIGSRVAQFLSSVHPYPRTIYITRHGESEYNAEKKIGGDSSLSPLGRQYAQRLAEFADMVICGGASHFACVTLSPSEVHSLRSWITEVPGDGQDRGVYSKGDWSTAIDSAGACSMRSGMRLLRLQRGEEAAFEDAPRTADAVAAAVSLGRTTLVFAQGGRGGADGTVAVPPVRARLWTSSLKRTRETVAHFQHPMIDLADGRNWEQMSHRIYRNLDEVYAGEFEGLTYDEVKRRAPTEANLRRMDKLGYRYPRGESYYDIIARLDSPVQQLETIKEPILIVGHQAVHRLLYAFLKGIPREQAIDLDIPLHTVIRLDFDGTNSFQEVHYFLGPARTASDGQKYL